jgi:hypothetical protein
MITMRTDYSEEQQIEMLRDFFVPSILRKPA